MTDANWVLNMTALIGWHFVFICLCVCVTDTDWLTANKTQLPTLSDRSNGVYLKCLTVCLPSLQNCIYHMPSVNTPYIPTYLNMDVCMLVHAYCVRRGMSEAMPIETIVGRPLCQIIPRDVIHRCAKHTFKFLFWILDYFDSDSCFLLANLESYDILTATDLLDSELNIFNERSESQEGSRLLYSLDRDFWWKEIA